MNSSSRVSCGKLPLFVDCRASIEKAKKANLDINPHDGPTLEQNVKEILKLEPSLVGKLKEILK